jgi:hypothetical protein
LDLKRLEVMKGNLDVIVYANQLLRREFEGETRQGQTEALAEKILDRLP